MSQRVVRGSLILTLSAVVTMATFSTVRAQDATRIGRQTVATRMSPQVAVQGQTAQQILTDEAATNSWLISQLPGRALDNPVSVIVTNDELSQVDAADSGDPGPMKVGVVHQLAQPVAVTFSNAVATRTPDGRTADASAKTNKSGLTGALEMTDDGGFVWATSVVSTGAVALRVELTNLSLPRDADLFVFNTRGEAYGPIQLRGPNGDGQVWLPSVMSDEAIILVRDYGPNGARDLRSTTLTISAVGHVTRGFPGQQNNVDGGIASFCPFNASCIYNANCQSTGPAAAAEGAVAKMLWISGAYIYICTGGLIADTDNSTEIPYFLTAHHCISKGNDAKNLEAYFQYSVACNASCPAGSFDPPPAPKTVGASIVSSNRGGDYTLLQLNQSPPSGSVYLGWNATPIANTNGASLYRISHPMGAPQAYSEHQVDTGAVTCQGWPRGERIYSDDVFGATEGGSSGSPVVNSNGEIVGQLSGCCGYNCNDVCDTASNSTVDGAFAYYFSNIEQYLDPAGGCTPTTASCTDGIDNDCDGLVDCADTNGGNEDCTSDPACQSGGCINPGGAPAGASCTNNSDCCSDSCKGKPGGKTCR